jgi:hypothetical protein
LDNIPEPEVRRLIEEQFLNKPWQPLTQDDLDKALHALRYADTRPLDRFMDDFLEVDRVFMDAYLLGRMFRTFPDKQHHGKRLPRGDKDIVYVGGFHAEEYRAFLTKLGFQEKHQSRVLKSLQCVDVPEFPPYFEPIA